MSWEESSKKEEQEKSEEWRRREEEATRKGRKNKEQPRERQQARTNPANLAIFISRAERVRKARGRACARAEARLSRGRGREGAQGRSPQGLHRAARSLERPQIGEKHGGFHRTQLA